MRAAELPVKGRKENIGNRLLMLQFYDGISCRFRGFHLRIVLTFIVLLLLLFLGVSAGDRLAAARCRSLSRRPPRPSDECETFTD